MKVLLSVLAFLGNVQLSLSCVNGAGAFATSLCNVNQYCNGSLAMQCGQIAYGDTQEATYDGSADCGVSHKAPQLWYHVDIAQPTQLKASLCNTETLWDTQLSMFSGSSCANLKCLDGINDGCGAPWTTQSLMTAIVPSGRYYILVHGYGTKAGRFAMTLQCAAPPSASRSKSPLPSRSRSLSPVASPIPSRSASPKSSLSSSRRPSPSRSKSPKPVASPSQSVSPSPEAPPVCRDTIADWVDSEGDSCALYQAAGWCSPDGSYGPAWDPNWGVYSDFANEDGSANDYCCECGGGIRSEASPSTSPVPVPPTDACGGVCEVTEHERCNQATATCQCVPGYERNADGECEYPNGDCPANAIMLNDECRDCVSPCAQCRGAVTYCTVCVPGKFLLIDICVDPEGCPAGTLPVDGVCRPCKSPCTTCTDDLDDCTSCIVGKYLLGDKCVNPEECPLGTLAVDGVCRPCISPCATCTPGLTVCTSCVPGTFLLKDICVGPTGCPAGTIPQDGLCKPCSSPCTTCTGSTTNCNSCIVGSFLNGHECEDNADDCPDGTLGVDGECRPCIGPCATCSSSLTICTACHPGTFLHNGMCLAPEGCPAGTVADDGLCKPCKSPCTTCKGGENKCTGCAADYYLSDDKCVVPAQCPSGTVALDRLCRPCVAPCATCVGAVAFCTTCIPGKYLLNEICVDATACPSGTTPVNGMCRFTARDAADWSQSVQLSEASSTRPAWVWVMVAVATIALAALAAVSWSLYRTKQAQHSNVALDEMTVEGALPNPLVTAPVVVCQHPTPMAPDRYARI